MEGLLVNSYTHDRAKEELDDVTSFFSLPSSLFPPSIQPKYNQSKIIDFVIKIQI